MSAQIESAKGDMHSFINKIAKWLALLGGVVLVCLVLITCVSVIGRSLNTIGHTDFITQNLVSLSSLLQKFGPINGDFEMVEMGIAFAIMAFFPWCMINRGHATVDVFSSLFPFKANRFLEFFWEIIFFLALALITWRLYVGTSDKMRYGETTFLLQTPIWWGYAACFVAAIFATIVSGYVVYQRLTEFTAGSRSQNSSHGQNGGAAE